MEETLLGRGPAFRFAVLILSVVGLACGGANGAHDAGSKDSGSPHADASLDQNPTPDAADGDAPQDAGATDAGPDAADSDASQDADTGPDASASDAGPQGCHQGDFNFDDDFSQGLRPRYWSVSYVPSADAGVFTYTDNTGELTFAKAKPSNTALKNIGATLDLTAAGGPVLDDFAMRVDFRNAKLGATQIDQIELHAEFGDSSIFYDVYSNESGLEFHVWDGALHGVTATTAHEGTLKISRVGTTLSAYAVTASGDGGSDVETLIYSTQQAAKPELRLVRFVAQNFDTDNDISVTFDNFHIEGSCAP